MTGRILIGLAAAALFIGLLASPTGACGCVEPMSETALKRLIVKAKTGDIDSVARVWTEIKMVRGDAKAALPWKRRAIALGVPSVMDDLADDWMWAAQDSANNRHKGLYFNAAIRLLENGQQHRRDVGGMADIRGVDTYLYLNSLREARAAASVHDKGVGSFEARALKGDIDAAYHAAVYHFWVRLNQSKRARWENLASRLGEPQFAGMHIGNRTKADAARDIAKAMRNRDFIATLGDAGVQRLIQQELRKRQEAVRGWTS